MPDSWYHARKLYRWLAIFPGSTRGDISRAAGLSWGGVESRLLSLERYGFLLSEDDCGRLWPWRVLC
jgi:hypothetical protein